MVSCGDQAAPNANMFSIRKPFAVWFATRATLTCSTSIDGKQRSSSVLSFVRQFCEECRPSRVVYCTRKHASGQSFNLQVFDNNQTVVIGDFTRRLVLKIIALVEHLAVNLLNDSNRFLPTLRGFHLRVRLVFVTKCRKKIFDQDCQ